MSLLLLGGCFHAGLHAHTADLVEPGGAGIDVGGTLVTATPGVGELAGGSSLTGSYGLRQLPDPMIVFAGFPAVVGQVTTRVGLARGVELDLVTGLQELGGGVRLALASEDRGDPLSATLDLGVGNRPLFLEKGSGGPRATVGMALSHRGTHSTPLVDLQLGYGTESYAIPVPDPLRGTIYGNEYGSPPTFDVQRDELRLTGALGLSTPRTTDHAVVVAIEPYLTLFAAQPRSIEAYGARSPAEAFRSAEGASLQVEVQVGGS